MSGCMKSRLQQFPYVLRSSLPIWVRSPTSCIIRKLKSLQRKLNSEPSPALRSKVRSQEDLVASKINEDLILYEECIFKSRQSSTIQRYLRYIRRPDPTPTEICHVNSTTNTDEEKSVVFNTFFCSVFPKSSHHEDECTAKPTEIPAILVLWKKIMLKQNDLFFIYIEI